MGATDDDLRRDPEEHLEANLGDHLGGVCKVAAGADLCFGEELIDEPHSDVVAPGAIWGVTGASMKRRAWGVGPEAAVVAPRDASAGGQFGAAHIFSSCAFVASVSS